MQISNACFNSMDGQKLNRRKLKKVQRMEKAKI